MENKKLSCTSFFFMAIALFALTSCRVEPEPLNDWERAVRVDKDVQEMFGSQRTQVIAKPISLYDAFARALKYNLDSRLKLMEAALAQSQYNLSSMDMLPKISANAGYATRNDYEAVVSKSMQTGIVSSDSYAYNDKSSALANVQVTWNILDFGVSYYQAKQDVNKILIAKEQRRKLTHSLLQEVRGAYWRSLAAERLMPQVDAVMEEATFALENARAVEEKRLKDPSVILTYQMTLMETMRDLNEMKKELLMSRERLASLMNLKPGTSYRLVGPEEGNYKLPEIRSSLDRLEWLALMNRPELREEDYRLQNTRLDVKKSLLKLLPNLNLGISGNYDSDSFLYNSSWLQGAAQLGYNLLSPAYMQKTLTKGENQEAVDNLRRQAVAMAVLTQTHISWGRYKSAQDTYQLSVEISDVAQRLAEQSASSGTSQPQPFAQADAVASEARSLFAQLRSAMSFAELQDATGSIFVSIGIDPLPDDVIETSSVDTLSKALQRVVGAWDLGRFTNEDYPRIPPVPMHRPVIALNIKLPTQKVFENDRFVMTIDPVSFDEAELGRDHVTYSATMKDGSKLLPWLYFDQKTLTLSGSPLGSTSGVYEVKILARNKQKMSAYLIVLIQVLRGYKPVMDLRGADPDARVTVIEKCTTAECGNYPLRWVDRDVSNKVIITPIYPKKK